MLRLKVEVGGLAERASVAQWFAVLGVEQDGVRARYNGNTTKYRDFIGVRDDSSPPLMVY